MAGNPVVRARWTTAGRAVLGCVSQRAGWVEVTVPTPGTYRVVADFDGRLRGDQVGCQLTAGAG
jgi:hypothetical protein